MEDAPKEVDMRKPTYSVTENPFLKGTPSITTKHRTVRTRATPKDLMDPETGEIAGQAIIHTIEEKDDQQFVKVFADGVKAAFELRPAAGKVFQAVLQQYQLERMTGGFADCVTLYWFGAGLNGHEIGMSERTFQRGLKELVEKGFLAHRAPSQFWVNPTLFFKGDRVAFLREYRRQSSPATIEARTSKRNQSDIEDFTK